MSCAAHSLFDTRWVVPRRDSPLVCADCGIAWPGHQLPTPIHKREGYGAVGEQPSWNSRVEAMVGELQEIEV